MFVRKTRGSSFNRRALSRSLRLGVSATGLMLASAALSPAMAQVRDLAGGTVNATTFGPFTVYTNGTFGAIAGAGGLTYGGAMNDSLGAFTLNKTGIGTLTLTGSGLNTYSGQTTVSNGILAAGAANVLSANSVLRINSASVALNGFSQSVAALSGNGPLGNSGAAIVLTLAGTAATQTQNGSINGDIKIVKNGAYRQNFNGASTFTGGIDVNGGTISYGTNTAFGTGTITFNTDASLTPLNFGRTIANNIVLGGIVTHDAAFSSTLSGQISGTGSITKLGNNALTLSNTGNNFSGGLILAAGQVNFANGSLGTGTITTLAQQVTMSTSDPSATINNNIVLGSTLNFELPNAPGTLGLTGQVSGAGNLFLKAGTGTLVLMGNNTFLGGVAVGSGTLGLQSNAAAGPGGIFVTGTAVGLAAYANGLNIANAIRAQVITGVDTRGFDMTLSGVISNVSPVLIGGLNKTGAGTLTLTNANTYTGATTVSAGRLNVNGSLVSAVTVNNGATLGGTGTIANTVTVANGGTIAPGTSPGTLTVNNLLLNAGSFLNFELANPAITTGMGVNDLIIVTNPGGLTLDGTINVTALPGFFEGTYRVINYSGALTNNGLLIGTTPTDFSLTVDIATAGQVNLMAVFNGTRFWDGTGPFGNGIVNGGTGTWNAVNQNWTGASGLSQVVWGSTAGVFAGTAGTVTLAGTQAFTNLDFQTAGYTLTGDNLAINNSTINTSVAGVTTVDSIIQGTNGLTKAGVGTLVLNGANTFTGGLAVNAGTVRVGSNNALGAGNATFAAGTTLQGTTVASPTLANDIVLGGAVTFDANGGATTLNGVISGNGAVSISDVGPANVTSGFAFGGANTFTGNVNVTNTLLIVAGNNGLGNAANTLTLNNAILRVQGSFTTPRTVTLTGTGTILVEPGLTLTANGAVGGAGQLVKDGAGTLVLGNAANSYGGGTVITNGTVSVASNGALGNAASGVSFSGTTLLPPTSPTTLRFTAAVTSDRAIGIATGFTGVIDTVANEVTLSGAITGDGALGKAGSGRLTLTGVNNTYAGGTNLAAGTLRISNSNAIGSGAVNTTGGTTFTAGLTNDNSVITLANNFVLGVGTTSVQLNGINFSNDIVTGEVITDGTDLTINGVISGAGGLTTTGASGRLFLNGDNNYAGGTTLNRTVAYLGNGNGLGTGQVTLENFGGILNESGSALTATNAIFVNGTRNIIGGGSDLTVTGAITGAQILNKAGTGTVTLTNINSGFSGTLAINQGTLLADGALSNAAVTVAVGQGTTLGGVGTIAGTVNVANFATLSPGQSPGVLTIGTLNLLNNSLLSYEFGAANTIAGPLNDQVVVTGNLVLDGRLSVTQSAGGAFTKGVYNLFTYGALTNNNVIIDNLANGLTGVIQVNANANQVNLLITGPGQLFQYWDGADVAGNGVINGGTATWNTTDFNWTGTTDNDTVLPTADLNTTWQSGSVAIFRGTAGTVSLATNFTAAGLEFQTDGYTLINGGLTVTGGGLFARTEPGVTATINSPLSGAGLLTKQGTGTLVLGGNNTYVGGTALAAGTIGVTSNTALGTGSLAMADGTTLEATANASLDNAVAITGTGTVDTLGNVLQLNGIVSGGALTKVGAGTLSLFGTNTYAGGTNLNAGTILLGNDSALGSAGLAMADGTTLTAVNGARSITNAIAITGTGTINDDGNVFTLGGIISGGAVIKTGAGTVVLTAANTYAGGTSLNAGTIRVGNSAALGTGALAMANGTTLQSGAAALSLANAIAITGTGTVDTNGNTLTLGGVVSGDTLTKIGAGTLILSGANTYTLGTNLNAGTIQVNTNTALGTGALAMANGTSLVAGVADLNVGNDISLAGMSTIDTGAFLFATPGIISGAGSLTKIGSGVLFLDSMNTYAGGTNVNNGTVVVYNPASAGTGTIALADGTQLATSGGTFTTPNAITITGTASLLTQGAADLWTLSGVIADGGAAGTLAKNGAGTIILTNANTYTGGTSLNAGTITVGNNAALGTGALAMADGTTLQSGAAALSLANAVGITGTGTVDTNGNVLTLGGVISGATLTKISAGTLILNGANTYASGTNLNAGTIQVGTSTALGTGALAMADGTTLQSGAAALSLANAIGITGTGTIDDNGNVFTLGGVISGGAVTKVGAGTLVLNGTNTYAGGTSLTTGTLSLGNDSALGTGAVATADGTTIRAVGGTRVIANNFNVSGTLTVDANALDFNLGGVIADGGVPGSLVTRAGVVYLFGANTYTGGTEVQSGVVVVNNNASLGTGTVTLQNGTALFDAGSVTLANRVELNGTGSINSNGGVITLNGIVADGAGAGRLSKDGAGTLVLNGTNTYTGGTALNTGTIRVGNDSALGTGSLAMANGTTLQGGAPSVTLANAVIVTGTGTVDTAGNTLTLNGVVSGDAVTKIGAGTLVLNATNTYNLGTTLTTGTIQVGSNGALGTGALAMANGTTLQAGVGGLTTANAIGVTGTGTIDTQGFGYTVTGQISGGAVTKIGAGTLTLDNANTYAGGTNINAGTVVITTNTSLGGGSVAMADGTTVRAGAADLVVANAFALTGNDTIDTQAFTLTLGGVLSGAGGVTKVGTGTLTLTGASTYTGATAVNEGVLNVRGSLANTAVTVASGASLTGNGTIVGAVTILDGGILSPGNSPGTLTVGPLTLNNGSILNWEFGAANTIGGALNDLVIVNGDLVLDGILNVSQSAGGNFTNGIYEIIQYTGNLTDNILSLGGALPNGNTGFVQAGLVPGQVNLIVTQSPSLILFWDGADGIGNGVISGGSGTWSALSTNWTGAAPSALNTNWQSLIGVFQGTAGTISIDGPQAFEMLQFAVDGYTLNSGVAGSLTTAGAGVLFASTGANATINAPITGAGSIVKQGGGSITLNASNSYAGGTDLQIGTIIVGNDSALGTGTLAMSGGTTLRSGVNNLTIANTITTAGVGTVDTNGNQFTLSGVISGAGSISKISAGNLTLSGANSFNGLSIAAGSVTASTSNTALGAGTVSMANGTTLFIATNALTIANNFALAAGGETIDVLGNSVTLNGTIAGAGRLTYTDTVLGAGDVITINGTNTYTGGTSVLNTTIAINADAALGDAAGDLALTTATVRTGASFASGRAVSLTDTGTFAVAGGTTLTLGGVISGSGVLVTNDTGTLVLNGNNTYTGGTNHTAGTVVIGSNTALGTNTFTYNGEGTRVVSGVDNLIVANNFVLNNNNTLNNPFDTQAFTTTLSGQISGAGAFAKLGSGTLILTGNNSYAGGTDLIAGTISVGTNTAIGTGNLNFRAGTTLQAFADNVALANTISTNAGTETVDTQAFTFTLNGVISGGGLISKIGTGNLILNGNNSYTGGTNLTAGTITVGTDSALGTGALVMSTNTTLAAGVSGLTIANAITTLGTGIVNQGPGVFTLNGTIDGAGSISAIGSGNLILNGNNSFTNLGINNGRVTVGTNTAAGIGAIAMANNTTLAAGVSGLVLANNITTAGNGIVDQGTGIFTLNGVIDGAGSISTINTGNLVLNGNNAFTNLGIGAGTVTVGTNTAAGIGAISMANNTTLAAGVSGLTLANNITTAGNGIVDQGTGIFTLNGVIDGAGSISTINTGNLVLNGNNAFTNLGIGAGTVTVGTNTAAGIGAISMASNTTLAAGTSGLVLANNITTAGNGIVDQGTGIFTLNGVIDGAGSISTVNTGNLVLNGNNAFTNLGIGAGTVTVGTNTAAGIGAIAMANNTTLAAGVSGLTLANFITTAGNGIVNQGTGIFTLNGNIGGAGSISTVNTGNLVLNGTNTFTNLGIGAGTVTVGTNTAAGIGAISMANNTTLAAGTSGLVLANNITTAGNGIVNQGTGTFTLNGVIDGAGSISTVNTGNLILNGNNAFTNLGIGAGTVTVGTNTAAGIGAISMANNTTLAAGVSGLVLANNITTAGNGIVDQGTGIFTLNGVIDGAGSISTVNFGNLVLNGNNAFTNLGIGNGTVTVGTNTAAGIGGIAMANNTTLAAGTSGLILANNIVTAGNGIINQGTGVFTLNGQIGGAGSISTVNTGNLVLNGNNAFTNLGIGAGTVTVGTNTAAGIGAISMASNTTLAAGVSGLVLANNITTAGNGIVDQGTGIFTLNGVIDGAGSISTVNFGNLVLNGNNAFTNLGIGNGTVTVGTNTAAGIGGIAMANNTTLAAGVSGLVLANGIVTAGNGIINQGTGVFTLNGQIGGAGSISTVNTGNLVLNGNNAFTNLGIGAGTVTVGTNTAAGIGAISMASNTTLAAGVSGLVLANNITTAGNGIVDQGTGIFTLNGVIDGAGSISTVNFGNLVLNGNNAFTNLGIGNGTVTVGTNTAAGIGGIAMANNTTLAAGVSGLVLANGIVTAGNGIINQGTGVFTLNGQIGGAGSISTVNTGNLVLNGNNAFTNLGIGAGTVTVGTNTAAGIGAISMASNTTLAAGVSGLVLANNITTAGNGIVNQGTGTFTLNGVIDGAGSISTVNTGNLVLNGNNAFTNLGIGAGTVTVGTNTAAGIGAISMASNTTLAAGTSGLVLANNITTAGNGIVNQGTGTFTLNGVIDGAGSISTVNFGNLILNGNNAFTNLGIGNGTVTVGTNTAAGIGAIAMATNTTLAAGVSGLVLANSIQTAGNGIVNQGTGTFTLNGQISGPGSISSVNFGNLVLNGNNLFTNLGIGNGTVTVGTNTAAGIGAIAMATNTTLAAGVSGLVLANSIQTAGNGIVNQGTGTFTLNGQISGPGSISSVNFGNLVLNGNNLFTNLGIGNGTVTVGTNTAAGIGAIAMATNTTLAAGVSGLVLANSIQTAGNGIIDQGTGTFTLNGQISGPGSISSVNFGNLVLNGNNLFTNLGIGNGTVTVGTNTAAGIGAIALATGTTLAAGANNLTLANSIQTAGIGTINTGANTMTLTGIISGAGNITKTGTGILNLTAANIYTGGTVINAGTVGFSTASSFGTGTITVNSGTLLANANNLTLSNLINFAGAGAIDTAANALTVSSVISGSGRITKLGTGTLTLTGANTFTGGTTISAGTLVGSVATLGSGGILNNAALVFNQTVDATFNQVISGTGSITKQGAGALTIASVNTVSGPTTVTAGRLNVTGSLANSAVTLQTGTSLIGTGTVGALTAQSGSTVSPGATAGSVATLTVNGALNLAAGSTLAIDATPAGADRVTASGAATTAGNLVVTAAGLPFTTFNQSYTLVSGSSRTGTFATTTLGSFGQAFAPVLVYDATSVILRLAPNSLVTLGGANISGNALAVANSFDAAVRGGYNPQAFFGLYTQGANLPSALNQLSGELHSAERRAILDDTRVVREAAFDRLNAGLSAIAGSQSVTSENDGKATTFWLRAAGSWGTARADGIGSRFTTEQRGVLTGVDFATNGFKVGGMFYYSNTDVELASLGKSTVESVGGAIYGGYRQEGSGFAVGVGGSIASSNADGSRAITAPGLAQALTSNVDGTSYQVFGEIAFDLVAAENTRIEPFARAAYAKVDSKAFAETGGIAGVTGIGQSSDATLTTLGMRAAFTTGMATLSGSAGWQRTTGDRNAASILVIPGVNTPYSVSTVSLDKDAVALEAQASFSLSQKITLGVGYSGVIGDNNTNHGARATLTVGF